MKRITFLVMICLLLVSLSASAQQPLPPPMAPEQVNELMAQARASGKVRVIVEFAVPAATRSMSERERGDAIKIARLGLLSNVRSTARLVANSETWTIPYAALEVDAAALQALAATPGVLAIGPDVPEPRLVESALPLIDVEDAHTYGTAYGFDGMTGEGWTVVVLDDGIQANHAFFGGRIVAEACFSTNSVSGSATYTSLCPNGQEEQFGTGSANTNPQCFNDCDHGTHVMGIAIGDDGATRKGVAPGANGIMLNVFSYSDDTGTFNDGPTTFPSNQIDALEYVKNTLRFEHSIASVNMSLGGGQFTAPCDIDPDPNPAFQARATAVNEVIATGIAVVIASGNNGYKNAVSRPGCVSDAITVSAVTDTLAVASFSNVSEQVDFFAPGVSINSSVPAVNGNYAVMDGTSMATPFVAGAWAVLKQAAPNASISEIRSALQYTGIPVVDTRAGAPGTITRPFIQVHDAMLELADQIYNGHMEFPGQPGLPDGWTGLNTAKRKCNTATKEFTPFGNCTVMLKVTLAGKAQIAQTNLTPDAYPSALLNFSAQIKAKNVLKGMLVLKIYNAAGLITPIKIITTGTSAWTLYEANPFVLSSELTRVKVVAKAVKGGKIFVDNISAVLTPATTTR